MNYKSYLDLDRILSAQKPAGEAAGRAAHDELLFIIIHQTYELWFKQLIYELNSVLELFSTSTVDERDIGTVASRLSRMNEIFKVLVQQVTVLETMTPMDFLEFRDLIYKASGFQSFQFRIFENKLGLRSKDRLGFNSEPYYAMLDKKEQDLVLESEKTPTLFECLESWLGRTPFLDRPGFKFWEEYKKATNIMFQQDEAFIDENPHLKPDEKKSLLKNVEDSKELFESLFNSETYGKLQKKGEWRLSYRAIHAALLIQLYREQPIFQLPFRLITEILNLDSHITQWRHRHAQLVKRMLGGRIGTGGSSGAKYLRESTERHKIFEDFYRLNTFFIPRNRLPELPKDFERELGFAFRGP